MMNRDEFKGKKIREMIYYILKTSPEYEFTIKELCKIINKSRMTVIDKSKKLEEMGYAKIRKEKFRFGKKEERVNEIYLVRWDGYL